MDGVKASGSALDVDRIMAKLTRLRDLDARRSLFGVAAHGYALRPPVEEKAVTGFEAEHGLSRLPEDYREYLTKIGNGGAGPFYGVFSLGEMDDGWGHAPWTEGDGIVGVLRRPFPHSTAWNLPAERLAPPESFESDEAENLWNAELDAVYWDPSLVDGAIPICHHGCALRTWLVVTGVERGNVWYDGRAENQGLRPHEGAGGSRLTFAQWYEAWLDRGMTEATAGDHRD